MLAGKSHVVLRVPDQAEGDGGEGVGGEPSGLVQSADEGALGLAESSRAVDDEVDEEDAAFSVGVPDGADVDCCGGVEGVWMLVVGFEGSVGMDGCEKGVWLTIGIGVDWGWACLGPRGPSVIFGGYEADCLWTPFFGLVDGPGGELVVH